MSKKYFQEIASEWENLQKIFFNTKIREKAFIMANISKGEVAADIGAGTGYVTEGLLLKGLKVIAIDQSDKMLLKLNDKFQTKNFDKNELICKVGEGENLPLKENQVDYAFANMYLHHVNEPINAIKEMVRITKHGGKIVISDMDTHDFEFLKEEHYDRWKGFKRDDLRNWYREAGLINVLVVSSGESCSATSTSSEKAITTVFIAIGEKI